MAKTPLYVILGCTGSGRREVLADLVTGGFDSADSVACLLPEGEPPSVMDGRIGALHRWTWQPGKPLALSLPEGAGTVFLVLDGSHNPVDQLEALKAWLPTSGAQLQRILCVVNCRFAHARPEALAWYDACIHFSDVVLLNRREEVPNKWISDFIERYRSQYLPCLIEMVKSGRVKNPSLLLDPDPRRISQAFDEAAMPGFVPPVEVTDEDEEDEDDDEEEGEESPDEDENAPPAEDPYFVRRIGGRRLKPIPDIAELLKG